MYFFELTKKKTQTIYFYISNFSIFSFLKFFVQVEILESATAGLEYVLQGDKASFQRWNSGWIFRFDGQVET